jgi:putative hemolysin
MSGLAADFLVVLLFVLIGGFFAAAELALVSLREGQIDRLAAEHPRRGARLALLARDPNRFLAAVQVGVTLAGFLSAGFGASRISPQVSPWLQGLGLSQGWADTVAFVAITVLIAYLSLVLGELVPKRLALQRTEGIALRSAGVIDLVSRVSRPFIWLLSKSTDAVVRLLGGDPAAARERISEDELRGLVASHQELSPAERELIDEVFAAGDRELREVMVPRTEVAFLAADLTVAEAVELIGALPHSRYPVIGDSADDVTGFVHVRDLLRPGVGERGIRVGRLVRDVARLPGSKRVIPAMTELRDEGHHLAIVVDEYGGTDGIVTLEDLVEELIGDIRDEYDLDEEQSRAPVGTEPFDIAGLTNLEDFADECGITVPDGPYETLAGYVIACLGRLPEVGDTVADPHARYTVLAMDGRRIDRLHVAPVASPQQSPGRQTEPGVERGGAPAGGGSAAGSGSAE